MNSALYLFFYHLFGGFSLRLKGYMVIMYPIDGQIDLRFKIVLEPAFWKCLWRNK